MGIQLSSSKFKAGGDGASSEGNLVGHSYDVDPSVFMLGAAGTIFDEKYLILR
ncbi:hypothetical protein [Microcoleus sp.]|uniref:hypothetical protein n=1 Tax=Microcoleus sp. TaxID=44472 RepID=UPI00403E9B48